MPRLINNRYRVLEQLGAGGEGRVVRALDKQHDRHVALKIRPLGNGLGREDVLREARILLSLQPHPGLPLVRDDFFVDDEYFVSMDWVDGTDLAKLVAERGNPGLPPSSVLRYLAQAAEALTHLHSHDPPVVHGDIKPANLVLSHRGRVVLVDFGVSSSPLAKTKRAGTPGFIAPEVAAGGTPTRASDIYSLAATAYALLTGAPPSGERSPMRGPRATAIESAIRLGLATDPARRPGSAGELVERMRAGWETDLPTGVLTFCMTDIEGSTPLWDRHPGEMARALLRHDAIVADCVEQRGGRLIRSMGEGDSTFSVFQDADAAVRSMIDVVRRLEHERWPPGVELRVRAGVHTGEAELRGADYFGGTINRTARLRGLADGGQIFLSQVTADLVTRKPGRKVKLVDLGRHTLKGLDRPENVFAVSAPGLRTPPSPAVCPFRGLLSFGPDEARFFFGREAVVADLRRRLERKTTSLVAVVGASGSGKSSVVRAGLPEAKAIAPGPEPTKELRAAGRARVLVVDQFEELFTLCTDAAERRRFVKALLARGKVVIALRADFYGDIAAFPDLAAAAASNQVLLGPMQPDELRRAIEAPAAVVGLGFEAGLVDEILRDVVNQPGALPLLEHALLETWERRDGRTLTREGYIDSGGVRGAIARTADREYEDLDDRGRLIAQRIFLRLTQLGEGTEDTRRRVAAKELRWSDVTRGEVDDVLARLVDARLVIADQGTVEVAHEALIREWPRLRAWLDEDREGLRIHRHLTDAAQAWEEMDRDPGELYRGARLEAVVERTLDLTPVEAAFVDESRAAVERERESLTRTNRRLRGLLAGVAVALVLVLIAGAVALVQRSSARRAATKATVSKLAAQSRELSGRAPDLSLLLALEANRHADSFDSRSALLGALARQPRLVTQFHDVTSDVLASRITPDGRRLAVVTQSQTTFYDMATHRVAGARLHNPHNDWHSATFTPDGNFIAFPTTRATVEFWNMRTRRKAFDLVSPDGQPLEVIRFTADGTTAAVGANELNHLALFDMRTRRLIGKPIETNAKEFGAPHAFFFTQDGKTVAARSAPGEIAFWTVATQRRSGRPLNIGAAGGFASALERIPNTHNVVVAQDDSSVSVWDYVARKQIGKTLSGGDVQTHGPLAISPDGRIVAVGSANGPTILWDLATGARFGADLQADSNQVFDVSWSPDSTKLVSAHSASAALWDVGGGQPIGRPIGAANEAIFAATYSRDGKLLATGQRNSVVIRDAATLRPIAKIPFDGDALTVDFGAGVLAAAGTQSRVHLIDVARRREFASIDLGDAWSWQVAFSPDAKRLAVSTDPNSPRDFYNPERPGDLRLFDASTRRPIGRPMVPGAETFSVLAVAWSPDGTLLASGSYAGRVQVWNAATQAPVGRPHDLPDQGVLSVGFPSNARVIEGNNFGVLRQWNVRSGKEATLPLEGQADPVTAISAHGLLASTTVTGKTQLWDADRAVAFGDVLSGSAKLAADQVELGAPEPLHTSFSPDGRRLAVGGISSRAMVWTIDPDEWRTTACAAAGRNMTRAEWRLYLPGEAYRRTCREFAAGPPS